MPFQGTISMLAQVSGRPNRCIHLWCVQNTVQHERTKIGVWKAMVSTRFVGFLEEGTPMDYYPSQLS